MAIDKSPRVRITSGGAGAARVFINDVDVSNAVAGVSWSMRAGEPTRATVDFWGVEIDAEAQLVEPPPPRFATERDRESFLAMFGDKLDDYFTPEFAAFVRRGPQPVEPGEHVVNRDEPGPPAETFPPGLPPFTPDPRLTTRAGA